MEKCKRCHTALFVHSSMGSVCSNNQCTLFKKMGVQKTASQSSFSRKK